MLNRRHKVDRPHNHRVEQVVGRAAAAAAAAAVSVSAEWADRAAKQPFSHQRSSSINPRRQNVEQKKRRKN